MRTRWETKQFSKVLLGAAALGLAGLLLAGCNKVAPVDTRAAEQAVKDADAKWSTAASTHDFNHLFAYYADDATVLPANEEMLTNKPGVQKYWSDHLTKNVDVSWTPMYVESAKSGDLVYDLGSYTMTTKSAKGPATTDHGKYMAVWKKQPDGTWKAEADSWNSDQAPKTR